VSRAEFQLQVAGNGDGSTPAEVTVTGEVDASNVRAFAQSLEELPGPRPVILQLSNIRYLDSAGFSALDRILADDAILIVLAPNSFMYRVAELMCMPIHHDVAAARQVLQDDAS
jgi:anti-sigma B factor antagonist